MNLYFDIETEPFAPGAARSFPPFVVAGYAWDDGPVEYEEDVQAAEWIVHKALEMGHKLVGHNLAFDLGVLGVVPRPGAVVHDTMIVDMLQRLADDDCEREKPSPPMMRSLEKVSGLSIEGKGDIQLSYKAGHPLTPEQYEYLGRDVYATRVAYKRQTEHKQRIPGGYPEVLLHLRARMALDRIEQTGFPVNPSEIRMQEVAFKKLQTEARKALKEAGIYQAAYDGPRGGKYPAKLLTKPMKELVLSLYGEVGEKPAKTQKGNLKMDAESLQQFQGNTTVDAWLQYKGAQKVLSTFLKRWDTPGACVHAKYNLLMRSGRTSSYGPNLQQVPSRGERGRIKAVFVPPRGRELYEIDYCQLELCVLAHLTGGRMRDLINAGEDLHRKLGALYFAKDEKEVTKDERQLMKCANFGLPGGMGVPKFRKFIRQNGLPDPGKDAAWQLVNAWLALYPEMNEWLEDCVDVNRVYGWIVSGSERLEEIELTPELENAAWDWASSALYDYGRTHEEVPGWLKRKVMAREPSFKVLRFLANREVIVTGGRRRCPVSYTEWHNTKFQGLAANLTKDMLGRVLLDGPGDWLVHAFVHDAVVISVPCGDVHGMHDVVQRMIAAAAAWLPDVRAGVEVSGPGLTWYEAKNCKNEQFFNEEWSVDQ